MHARVFRSILLNDCLLDPNRSLVAGISGGPDSLCMLDLILQSGFKVIAVHVNHQLRPEAEAESHFVQEFCEHRTAQCVIGRVDVSDFVRETKSSVEESARILRYRFLFEQASKHNAQAVLVAHNADDQAETVLMHLLRGSGLSGLKGMQMRSLQPQWSGTIPLVRPLLGTLRREILEYCHAHQLSPVYDQSNQDERYFRNRIRQSLLPELISYNPRVKEHLLSMSDVIGHEDDYLRTETQKMIEDALILTGKRYLVLARQKILQLHPALLRRVLREAIHRIEPNQRDIDFTVINRCEKFIKKQGNVNHLLLQEDVEVIKEGRDRIIFCDQHDPLIEIWPQMSVEMTLDVPLHGKTSLGGGWWMSSQKVIKRENCPNDPFVCEIDAKNINRLSIETTRPGDRFSPFSLKGESIKVSDFWTKKGLPERARRGWPIVKNQDQEIIWLPGFQISNSVKITPHTTVFLRLEVSQVKMD